MHIRASLPNLRFSSDWDRHNTEFWEKNGKRPSQGIQEQYFKRGKLINSVRKEPNEDKYTALLENAYDNGKGIKFLEASLKQVPDKGGVDFLRRVALFLAEKTKIFEAEQDQRNKRT